MNPLDDIIIENILRANDKGIVLQKEDDKIEYKKIFDNQSKEAKAKYCKELAALYNYEGGYLIFGVDDDTRELIGLESFAEPDNADLSNDINSYFSPAIRFQSKVKEIEGKTVFIIYVNKCEDIPTVCIKSHQKEINEGVIYWRYSAQSSPIKSGDLINLMNSLKGEETKKLTELVERDHRSKSKPRLKASGGSYSGYDPNFSIKIDNKGELCFIRSCVFLEGDIISVNQKDFPLELEKDSRVNIPIHIDCGIHAKDVCFKLLLNYRDNEGYDYTALIERNKGKTRALETERVLKSEVN